jgi:hypothetical protein
VCARCLAARGQALYASPPAATICYAANANAGKDHSEKLEHDLLPEPLSMRLRYTREAAAARRHDAATSPAAQCAEPEPPLDGGTFPAAVLRAKPGADDARGQEPKTVALLAKHFIDDRFRLRRADLSAPVTTEADPLAGRSFPTGAWQPR